MDFRLKQELPVFLEVLGVDEEPVGIVFSDEKPAESLSPKPLDLPTREKEMQNAIDWQAVFGGFSCVMGVLWRARKKQVPAAFSAEQFGCPGGAFWMGFLKPQTETIIHYVSTGVPGRMEGEHYCDSPEALKKIFDYVDPRPAPKPYCVIQPLSFFSDTETPELVSFFARPETLCGLHQLAAFVTNDPEAVCSPWSAACGSLVAWPLHYREKGKTKAVVGGWDPSARKFFKTDELSFTVPFPMFAEMIRRWESSFLTQKTWRTVKKKIERSRRAWGGTPESGT